MPSFGLTKMHGAANSFLIFDTISAADPGFSNKLSDLLKYFNLETRSELAQKLCDIKTGLGADGFLVLEPSEICDFKWDFYNQDGSEAEMCGNAARCVCLYANDKKIVDKKSMAFESAVGKVLGEVLDENQIQVELAPIIEEKFNQKIDFDDKSENYDFINTGVPHSVVQDSDLDFKHLKNFRQRARRIREAPLFQPKGTNATFFKPLKENQIRAASFERGVEDFTLACGTGAVAAARSFYFLSHQKHSRIQVHMPGGLLEVDFSNKVPKLIGPAEYICFCKIGVDH